MLGLLRRRHAELGGATTALEGTVSMSQYLGTVLTSDTTNAAPKGLRLYGFHFLDYLFVDGNSDLAGFESLSALVPAAADTTFGGGDEDDAGGKPVEYRGYVYTSGTLAAGCPGMDLGRVVCHSSYCDTEEVWRIANDWCDCGPGAGVARAAGGSALLLFVHFEDESPADADRTALCD